MEETVEVRRPSYSVLDSTKFSETSGQSIPHWEESLAKSIQKIVKQVERELRNEI
jgi:dTDP-4-dehydrorhamnose reductase